MATRGSPVAWDDFYKTARWQRLRKFQLLQHPLCKFCLQRGIVTSKVASLVASAISINDLLRASYSDSNFLAPQIGTTSIEGPRLLCPPEAKTGRRCHNWQLVGDAAAVAELLHPRAIVWRRFA